jgi:sodium transport system permease protein
LGTVVFSLLSMTLTFLLGGAMLKGGAGRSLSSLALPSLDPVGLVGVVALVLPMAVLFAAGLLAISVFAKSFKEAQSYVSPLVIIIVLPAIVGMLPGVELNARLALVPVLNVSLASKELVSGEWPWSALALIFGSTCLYAAAALALAVRMFSRESVIFRT